MQAFSNLRIWVAKAAFVFFIVLVGAFFGSLAAVAIALLFGAPHEIVSIASSTGAVWGAIALISIWQWMFDYRSRHDKPGHRPAGSSRSARRDGSIGIVETVITNIRETSIERDGAGAPLNEGGLTPEAEKFWTVVLERFAVDVVNRTLPSDPAARNEALEKARRLGIGI